MLLNLAQDIQDNVKQYRRNLLNKLSMRQFSKVQVNWRPLEREWICPISDGVVGKENEARCRGVL